MKKSLALAIALAAALAAAEPVSAAPPSPVFAAPRGGGGRYYRPGYRGYYRPYYPGRWGWGWGWGWGWPGWYGGAYYGGPGYGYPVYAGPPVWAAVDTDVSPEEARVFLDGRYIGIADDFDGYPDYLYLRRGDYRLEFRLDGFETKVVEVQAQPGEKIDIGGKLAKIPGSKQYGSYDTPKPEGGVQRFWGKGQEKDSPPVLAPPQAEPPGDWRDRDSGAGAPPQPLPGEGGQQAPAPQPPAGEPAGTEVREAPKGARARILFQIEPQDAVVYLDDRFVGTGEEVSSLRKGIAVSAGRHTITVSRPGYADETEQIEVEAGSTETVKIALVR